MTREFRSEARPVSARRRGDAGLRVRRPASGPSYVLRPLLRGGLEPEGLRVPEGAVVGAVVVVVGHGVAVRGVVRLGVQRDGRNVIPDDRVDLVAEVGLLGR